MKVIKGNIMLSTNNDIVTMLTVDGDGEAAPVGMTIEQALDHVQRVHAMIEVAQRHQEGGTE
jgi:hypothetical protein